MSTNLRTIGVFGERNPGTNLVTALIEHHTATQREMTTAPRPLAMIANKLNIEQPIDWYFSIASRRQSSWKHASADRIEAASGADTAVVIVVRDPFAWLEAMARRPYHIEPTWSTLTEFISSEISPLRRESTRTNATTPVELWNRKTAGYVALADRRPWTSVLRYEDLLFDADAAMTTTLHAFGVEAQSRFTLPDVGVKQRDTGVTSSTYQERYAERRHLDQFDADLVDRVGDALDSGLLQRLGYSSDGR